MTQCKVAEAVNVTESVISKYESGASDPSIATMKRLAKYYGVDPNYLLGWETEQHQEVTEDEFLRIQEAHGKMIFIGNKFLMSKTDKTEPPFSRLNRAVFGGIEQIKRLGALCERFQTG